MKLISLYSDVFSTQNPENLEIDIILDSIKSGLYEKRYCLSAIRLAKQNFVIERARVEAEGGNEKEDKKYKKAYNHLTDLKSKIPRVTIAGMFKPEGRSRVNLTTPSELIDLDIDQPENIEELKTQLSQDKYTYSVFKSCGGDGLCLLFRINPKKYDEAFDGISHYLFNKYAIVLDKAHRNPANTRNLSYDANLFRLDHYPPVFEEYLKKQKKKEEANKLNFVYAKADFESCIKQITGQQLDFCPDYESYMEIGFAIADKFGLFGLEYFDAVCQFGAKYNSTKLAKDYKHFCRNIDQGKKSKIATFFYRCKTFNIDIYTAETKLIASVASSASKTGKSKEDVIKNLEAHEGIKREVSESIVNQVFDEKIEFISQNGILDDIQSFLKYNYNLKVNKITGKFENNGIEWTEADFNTCLVDIKKVFDKADSRWIERILFSSFIPSYNPVRDFFEEHKDKAPIIKFVEGRPLIPDIIQALCDSLHTKSIVYTTKFVTKWMVGAVSTWFGQPSNLELIFAGELEKGKTWFIDHLLPDQLQKYYAESKLDKGKDDEILACQKILINQNECSGKDKRSDEEHKRFLDKEIFSIRRPFRRDPEDMKRLCALFGTTNKISDILTDKRGNRRIIVDEILGRDFKAYDAIDKTELWMAVYALWQAGFQWKILGDEIAELNSYSSFYEDHGIEYELICKYFEKAENERDSANMTASDIKIFIENKTDQNLRIKNIIEELYRMRYVLFEDKVGGISRKAYLIKEKIQPVTTLPF